MRPDPVAAATSVSRRFGSGAAAVTAVREATLRVFPGEVVSIIGPSGSGKTTLLCLIGGLLVPNTGEVAVEGRSLGALSVDALARLRRTRMGFVFQGFNLLKALTALENVEVGLRLAGFPSAEGQERASRALEEVGLTRCANRLPRELSGGEQQRVAIARALAPAPCLVLADEPTGNLDSANGRVVVEMLRSHARQEGAAVVVVTHDPRVVAATDRRMRMEDGILREDHDVEQADLRTVAG